MPENIEFEIPYGITAEEITRRLHDYIDRIDDERRMELCWNLLGLHVQNDQGNLYYLQGFNKISATSLERTANSHYGKDKWQSKKIVSQEQFNQLATGKTDAFIFQKMTEDLAFTGEYWLVWKFNPVTRQR